MLSQKFLHFRLPEIVSGAFSDNNYSVHMHMHKGLSNRFFLSSVFISTKIARSEDLSAFQSDSLIPQKISFLSLHASARCSP